MWQTCQNFYGFFGECDQRLIKLEESDVHISKVVNENQDLIQKELVRLNEHLTERWSHHDEELKEMRNQFKEELKVTLDRERAE